MKSNPEQKNKQYEQLKEVYEQSKSNPEQLKKQYEQKNKWYEQSKKVYEQSKSNPEQKIKHPTAIADFYLYPCVNVTHL